MTGSMLDTLAAYWPLWEASGTRANVHPNATDLTLADNNTVTGNPGKVRLASQFTLANSEYLSRADVAELRGSDIDFWWSVWIYADSFPGTHVILGKDGSSSNREYVLYCSSTGQLTWVVFNGGTTTIGQVSWGVNLSTATWYHIYAYHDSVSNQVGISVNNGAAQTAATSGAPGGSTHAFMMGNNGGSFYWNGRLCEVAFGKNGLLTADQRTRLYNGGRGLEYPWYLDRPLRGLLRGAMRGA